MVKIIVAATPEQARIAAGDAYADGRITDEHKLCTITTDGPFRYPFGLTPLPEDIILADGWRHGRNADEAERALVRMLAKRTPPNDLGAFLAAA